MAKDTLGKYVKIFFDESVAGAAREITASMVPNTLAGIGLNYENVDMTGQNDSLKTGLAGQADGTITAQFYLDTTATTGAYTVLEGMEGSEGTLTIQVGTADVPASGDPEWEGEYILFGIPASISAGRFVMTATWRPAPSSTPAWGTVT